MYVVIRRHSSPFPSFESPRSPYQPRECETVEKQTRTETGTYIEAQTTEIRSVRRHVLSFPSFARRVLVLCAPPLIVITHTEKEDKENMTFYRTSDVSHYSSLYS